MQEAEMKWRMMSANVCMMFAGSTIYYYVMPNSNYGVSILLLSLTFLLSLPWRKASRIKTEMQDNIKKSGSYPYPMGVSAYVLAVFALFILTVLPFVAWGLRDRIENYVVVVIFGWGFWFLLGVFMGVMAQKEISLIFKLQSEAS